MMFSTSNRPLVDTLLEEVERLRAVLQDREDRITELLAALQRARLFIDPEMYPRTIAMTDAALARTQEPKP